MNIKELLIEIQNIEYFGVPLKNVVDPAYIKAIVSLVESYAMDKVSTVRDDEELDTLKRVDPDSYFEYDDESRTTVRQRISELTGNKAEDGNS